MLRLPSEFELIAGAVAVAAAIGAFAWFTASQRAIGARTNEATHVAEHDQAVKVARAKDVQINATQGAADHEADRFHLAAALDARDALDADRRLQQRFAAINARCVPGNPAASAPGPAASDAADMRADVLSRIVSAARLAASAADSAHGAGLDAEQHYDALSPK